MMLLTILSLVMVNPAGSTVWRVPPDPPGIEVWTNRDDAYHRGERVRVYVRPRYDGFVTVLRVDTDGQIHVLFPLDPYDDNYLSGGQRYELQGHSGRRSFIADAYPGMGYVFALASPDPFDYHAAIRDGRWDHEFMSDRRIHGDPYVALTDLAVDLSAGSQRWDYDLAPYYVGNRRQARYDYPRFLCYDCHGYTPYPQWDPYAHSCIRFRIVVHTDPYYYPYSYYRRYHGGTRVVYARPARPAPRYVFKTWDRKSPYVTYAEDGERSTDRIRSRDGERAGADAGRARTPPPRAVPSRRTVPEAALPPTAGQPPSARPRRPAGDAQPEPPSLPERRRDLQADRPTLVPPNSADRRGRSPTGAAPGRNPSPPGGKVNPASGRTPPDSRAESGGSRRGGTRAVRPGSKKEVERKAGRAAPPADRKPVLRRRKPD